MSKKDSEDLLQIYEKITELEIEIEDLKQKKKPSQSALFNRILGLIVFVASAIAFFITGYKDLGIIALGIGSLAVLWVVSVDQDLYR